MNMKEELKKLKPGDLVFIEPGLREYGCPDWHKVSSVGRKYINIFIHNGIKKFDLETGRSVHGDLTSSAHGNGLGYQLHLTVESYRKKKECERTLSLVRDGLANVQQKWSINQDLAKDLLEVFKKHGLINDQS